MLARILRIATPRLPLCGSSFRAACEASVLGLLIGFADTRYSGTFELTTPAYFMAGVLLGLRHTGRSYVCWPLLGASLYVAHVIAMACGCGPPYVEPNYRHAEVCLLFYIPAGLGLLIGVVMRLALSESSRSWRESHAPMNPLPSTKRERVLAIACVAISLGCLQRVLFPPTIYAAGYDEVKFQAIRQGMTEQQVVAAVGQPLTKKPWNEGREMWQYSDQYTYTSNYDRRWIFFKSGLVETIVSDYWDD